MQNVVERFAPARTCMPRDKRDTVIRAAVICQDFMKRKLVDSFAVARTRPMMSIYGADMTPMLLRLDGRNDDGFQVAPFPG